MLVSLAAAWFAWRAVKANEAMVTEQQEANRLHADELAMTHQHRQEDRDERAAAAVAVRAAVEASARKAAGQVSVEYGLNAGIDVVITNDSEATIRKVRLVDLSGAHSTWKWRPNPAIPIGNRPIAGRLAHGERHTVATVFFDENDTMHRDDGQRYASLVRFTDSGGRRWEIGDSEGPRQVPDDDSDLGATGGE